MKSVRLSISLLGVCLASFVLATALPNNREHHAASHGPKSALYFLENDPAGSKLAALEVAHDGTLSGATETATGGMGLQAINATDGRMLGPDSLTGQGAVAVGDDYVFTINSGSNTLSMFSINPHDPTHPTLIGSPIDTLGEFPVSVTYSPALKTACVLNGGARNGITCFLATRHGLHALDKTARTLSPYLNTSTPPNGPPETASQIAFSPSSHALVVTIKGNPGPAASDKKPGTIIAYPVHRGKLARKGTATQIADIPMAFGFSFVDENRIFLSDVTYGGSLVALDRHTLHATEQTHNVAPLLKGSCWAAYSAKLGKAYAVDAGSPRFSVVDVQSGKNDGYMDLDPGVKGAFDTVVRGTTAFFLGAVGVVGVQDLETNKPVQGLVLTGEVGPRVYWQGLAMWPA